MGLKYTIAYTPYVSKFNQKNNKIDIPESSFLAPIKLSEEIVNDVIPKKEDLKIEKPKSNNNNQSLNLTWSRNAISTPKINSETKPEIKIHSNLDLNDIKHRQMMAESSGNANAVSRVGAKGLYQIMDPTLSDYISATGDKGNIFDPKYNERVRDWYMDWLGKTKIINTPGVSDFMKTARQLVAYNWGIGNLQKHLNKHRSIGTDIDNSLDWINDLPNEPKNYLTKILLDKYSINSSIV